MVQVICFADCWFVQNCSKAWTDLSVVLGHECTMKMLSLSWQVSNTTSTASSVMLGQWSRRSSFSDTLKLKFSKKRPMTPSSVRFVWLMFNDCRFFKLFKAQMPSSVIAWQCPRSSSFNFLHDFAITYLNNKK